MSRHRIRRGVLGTLRVPADLSQSARDESGAILMMALAYIIAVSLIVLALASWASNDLTNTSTFSNTSNLRTAVTSATNAAIQSIRHLPVPASPTPTQGVPTTPSYCWTPGNGLTYSQLSFATGPSTNPTTYNVVVWCSTLENLSSNNTRIVTFAACQSSLTPSSSASDVSNEESACVANPLLQAVVYFDDYSTQGGQLLTKQCNLVAGSGQSSCGVGMTLANWNWYNATGATGVQRANSIQITSTAPTNAAVGGATYTTSATAVSGDAVTVLSATSGTCTVSAGVVSFIGMGSCTLDFNDPGNASYLAAPQVTQTFSVGAGAPSQVVVTLSAPSASATTNAAVTLQLQDSAGDATTATTSTTLTLSDSGSGFFANSSGIAGASTLNVTFGVGAGTATVYFGDKIAESDVITATNGATSWGTASFTTTAAAASQVIFALSPANPGTSNTASATISMSLEDAFGNLVLTSSTFTLSDPGAGYFSNVKNTGYASCTATLSVTFTNGVATAYFGDRTSQSDTLSITNATVTSTSSSFTA